MSLLISRRNYGKGLLHTVKTRVETRCVSLVLVAISTLLILLEMNNYLDLWGKVDYAVLSKVQDGQNCQRVIFIRMRAMYCAGVSVFQLTPCGILLLCHKWVFISCFSSVYG